MAKKGKEKEIEEIEKEKLEEKEAEKTEEKEKKNKIAENLKLFDFDGMNKEVVYHNDFSNTIFTDFSLKEKQLLLFLIAGINNEDSNDKIYHFDPKEIKNMLSMERKSYGELSKIVHSIQKKPLVILTSKDTMDSISIFDKVTYNAKDQSISVSWGKSAIEMFKNLKGNFSKYFLTNVIKLQSENSVELYLKAESNLFKDNFFLSVSDIKKIFSVNYKSIGDMKKRLINCCTDDININTDILLNAIDVKEGRKIVGFNFKVSRKNLLNDTLKKRIEKIKKNIHVSKSGFFSDKKVDKTLHTLFRTFSEKELEKGLELCYKTIREDFKTLSYLEKAIKFALENESAKEEKTKKKKETVSKEPEKTKAANKTIEDNWFTIFNDLDIAKKDEIEKKALEEFLKINKGQSNFISTMKQKSPTMYYNTLKDYILKFMTEDTPKEEVKAPKKRGRKRKLDMIDEMDKTEEISKNEKAIKAFIKKKYGKEKMVEMLKDAAKYEEIMFKEYINLLKEKEKKKILKI